LIAILPTPVVGSLRDAEPLATRLIEPEAVRGVNDPLADPTKVMKPAPASTKRSESVPLPTMVIVPAPVLE
jgi:hypothetical protein